MITAKEALDVAVNYLREFYTKISNILLEEIELTEDERYWLITLSYRKVDASIALGILPPRQYKVFKIDAAKGQVVSMKMRDVK